MTSERASPIATISAAMLKVLACYQKRNENQHDPARRKRHDIGGWTTTGDPADLALTSWMAIIKGVVRNTVQSKP
jgi:hypothetical protein